MMEKDNIQEKLVDIYITVGNKLIYSFFPKVSKKQTILEDNLPIIVLKFSHKTNINFSVNY